MKPKILSNIRIFQTHGNDIEKNITRNHFLFKEILFFFFTFVSKVILRSYKKIEYPDENEKSINQCI